MSAARRPNPIRTDFAMSFKRTAHQLSSRRISGRGAREGRENCRRPCAGARGAARAERQPAARRRRRGGAPAASRKAAPGPSAAPQAPADRPPRDSRRHDLSRQCAGTNCSLCAAWSGRAPEYRAAGYRAGPISFELMKDPVMAQDGHTSCGLRRTLLLLRISTASAEYPRRRPRRRRNLDQRKTSAEEHPRNIHVVAAAPPQPASTEYPRRGCGAAATRLRGMSTSFAAAPPRPSSEESPRRRPRRRRNIRGRPPRKNTSPGTQALRARRAVPLGAHHPGLAALPRGVRLRVVRGAG